MSELAGQLRQPIVDAFQAIGHRADPVGDGLVGEEADFRPQPGQLVAELDRVSAQLPEIETERLGPLIEITLRLGE
ncbi:MAG TPA: hypothetical protein VGF34_20160, partial [Stellaceae bacterium]